MPEQLHSPEPWTQKRVGLCDRVHDANGRDLEYETADGFSQADIRRIIACVNACRGVETKWLESLVAGGKSLHGAMITVPAKEIPSGWVELRFGCDHERLNDHGDACLDCGAVYIEGKWA